MDCKIDGCERQVVARGWCHRHYMRWWTHGDPTVTKVIVGEPERRFWLKVDKRGPLPRKGSRAYGRGRCWLWTASLDTYGYGHMTVDGKLTLAHRYSYMMHGNELVEGLELDHLCRVRHCVRPDHLDQTTHAINTAHANRERKVLA